MLHQLAINLFEKDGVVHPAHKLLQIQWPKLEMIGLFQTLHSIQGTVEQSADARKIGI